MQRTVHTCSLCEKSDAHLPEPFDSCGRCECQMYCSEACKNRDWKNHRTVCRKSILDAMSPPEREFYQNLVPDNFLHGLPEKDVYDMLDDCFFLRIGDGWALGRDKKIKGGNMNRFRDFLDLAEERAGLLPPWWSEEKRRRCEKAARKQDAMAPGSEDYDTDELVSDHGLIRAYKDYSMPMKLRLLAEMIYGSKIAENW